MKKEITADELVNSHKPKNFRFKYIFKDESLLKELFDMKYDISQLDTIEFDELVNTALETAKFVSYDRSTISNAKRPTVINNNGLIISRKLATKTDKKLLSVDVGEFSFNNSEYLAIKLCYERFDIIQIFHRIV